MLRPGHLLVACTLALLTLGVVMVNSAGMAINTKVPVSIQGVLTSRSTIYLALAMLAMGLTAWFAPVQLLGTVGNVATTATPAGPERSGWSRRWVIFGIPACLALLLIVYLPGLGLAKKGAARWIKIDLPALGELSIQPSEVVKWGTLIIVAGYAAAIGPSLKRFLHGQLPILCGLALVAGVMALEDLGTAILITLVVVAMLIAGGVSIWRFALLVPVGLAGLIAAIVQQPYRLQRIETYLNPYTDPGDSGYHMIQSMVAVHNGEIWGRGLGNGLQKFGYLPEDTTDFVFAIICEELGVFGALAVTGVYLLMLWAGFVIVRKQQAPMLKLLGFGIIATVALQAIINIGVVTALLPTKGIALPLLSSGGTGWILTAASLGLLVAMDKLVAPAGEQLEVAAHTGGALVAIPVKESSSGSLAGA